MFASDGQLQVPLREIALSNDEKVCVYDTTGPQGHDLQAGLPRLRQPWIERRLARGDGNFSQMHYARLGEITEEMRFVALRENVAPGVRARRGGARAGPSSRPTSTTPSSSR